MIRFSKKLDPVPEIMLEFKKIRMVEEISMRIKRIAHGYPLGGDSGVIRLLVCRCSRGWSLWGIQNEREGVHSAKSGHQGEERQRRKQGRVQVACLLNRACQKAPL
jgi:hypothetical protein